MIPGEVFPADGVLVLNAGSDAITLMVANTGDRPVQVGSHYHFGEANSALDFDRAAGRGMRLDIAAGTAARTRKLAKERNKLETTMNSGKNHPRTKSWLFRRKSLCLAGSEC